MKNGRSGWCARTPDLWSSRTVGTIDDIGDDQWKVLTTYGNQRQTSQLDVFSVAEDQDGEGLIGTGKGIAVFTNRGRFSATRTSIGASRGRTGRGTCRSLLETEVVGTVVVDGGNQMARHPEQWRIPRVRTELSNLRIHQGEQPCRATT